MMENKLFERLKSINEECWTIEKQSDGNYHVMSKKRLLNNDGSDAGWLYTDIPNVRLDEHDKYVIEPPKEDNIDNRAERRYGNNENPMKNVETKQLPTKMYYEDSAWSRYWRKWWHESCDELGLPYDTSFKDFTLALGKRLYPHGVSYPPNRAERRKAKRKKQ